MIEDEPFPVVPNGGAYSHTLTITNGLPPFSVRMSGQPAGITYQLVGPLESDLTKNRISVTSPIGRALIGKSVGDEVSVSTPGGIREFEIVEISVQPED